MTPDIAVSIVGWAAAGMILAAYGLLTAGRLASNSAAYQWMNVVGAAGFIINSGYHSAMPSAVLNIIWAGIGIVALWQMRRAAG